MGQATVSGAPSDDPREFRRSLGEFCTGVAVITATHEGIVYGMTSNSFAAVSLDPALVLWSIRRESTSFDAFTRCSHFAVNILAEGQVELSNRFSKSGPEKFEGVDWMEGEGGAPIFKGTAASFECRSYQALDGGDHVILLGQVLRHNRDNRQPLLFSKGRYAVPVDHPDTRVFAAPDTAAPVAGGSGPQLLSLMLVRAYSAVGSRLEAGRRTAGLGLSLMQARLMKAVQMFPNRRLDELLPELLLDAEAAQNALDSTIELGLLGSSPDGRIMLSDAGQARLLALLDHAKVSEDYLYRNVSQEDLLTTHRVLAQIIEDGGRDR